MASPASLIGTSAEHKVQHLYHDHASDPEGDVPVHTVGGAGMEQSFPQKLHYMLNDIEKDGLSHIVSWQPHGRCFVVHNQKLFVEKILGCWFRQSKIASFQRQLNIYGFQRLTTGPDKNGYYHELFLRTKPSLAARIQRHKLKGTKTRRAASPESEPNFYSMKAMPPNAPEPRAAVAPSSTAGVPSTCRLPGSTSLVMDPTKPDGEGSNDAAAAASLTLQKIVPSLFSPASFETTVRLVPQSQSRQRGLMVTSTCSLTLKPSEAEIGGTTPFSLSQYPLTALTSSQQGSMAVAAAAAAAQRTHAGGGVTGPRSSSNNEAFWAALGGSCTVPTQLRSAAASSAPVASNASAPSPSLWMLR